MSTASRRVALAVLTVVVAWCAGTVPGCLGASGSSVALLEQSRQTTTILGITSSTTTTFLMRAAELYRIFRPEIAVVAKQADSSTTQTSTQIGQVMMQQGVGDFAFVSFAPAAADRLAAPDLEYYPLWATPFSAIYNLPSSPQLIVDFPSLCRVFTGNITMWNDPVLVALNPSITMPVQPIKVVLQSDPFTMVKEFTRACTSLDATFKALIGFTSFPKWPTTKYAAYKSIIGVSGPSSYILTTPYTIGLAMTSFAQKLGATSAAMRNTAGAVVYPTVEATSHAFSELGVQATRSAGGSVSYSWTGVLTQAKGVHSWPMTTFSGLVIPVTYSRQSCRVRSELTKFLTWVMNADAIRGGLATDELVSMIPAEVSTQLGFANFLQWQLMCGDANLNFGSIKPLATTGGILPTTTNIRELLFNHYTTNVRPDALEVTVTGGDEQASLIQMLEPDRGGRDADIAWLFPMTIDGLVASYPIKIIPGAANILQLPVAFFGMVIKHSVPTSALTTATRVASTARIPTYEPLVLDIETLGMIFAGEIGHWTDAKLVALNPTLTSAFASVADDTITLVVCGDGTQQAYTSTLSNHLVTLLADTAAFKRLAAASSGAWSLPTSWNAMAAQAAASSTGPRVQLVELEAQMTEAINNTPYSIGYALNEAATLPIDPSLLNWFDLLRTVDGTSSPMRITPNVTAIRACPLSVTSAWSNAALSSTSTQTISTFTLDPAALFSTSVNAAGCWPLTIQVSLAVPRDFTLDPVTATASGSDQTQLCQRGLQISTTVQWLLSTDFTAWSRNGVASAASIPAMGLEITKRLRTLTCGGSTVLWTPATEWVLSSAIVNFGLAIAGLGLVGVVISGAVVIKYRTRTVVRVAGFAFQFSVLLGISFLCVAIILLTATPTTSTCSALAWTLSLGFTLAIMMPALKLAHAWFHMRNLRAQQLKRHKAENISRGKMRQFSLLLLLLDIALLAAAQAKGGLLTPIGSSSLEGTTEHLYTTCSISASSSVFPHAIIIVAIKGLILIVCSVLGFAARRAVSAFNELEHMCRTTWNTTLCIGILIAISAITGANGDAAAGLQIGLLAWLTLVCGICVFSVKIWVMGREYWEHRQAQKVSRSSHGANSQTSGKLDASEIASVLQQPPLDHVSIVALEKYISFLERHLVQVRERRTKELGQPEATPPLVIKSPTGWPDGVPTTTTTAPRPLSRTPNASPTSAATTTGTQPPSSQPQRSIPTRSTLRAAALAAEGIHIMSTTGPGGAGATGNTPAAARQPLRIRASATATPMRQSK